MADRWHGWIFVGLSLLFNDIFFICDDTNGHAKLYFTVVNFHTYRYDTKEKYVQWRNKLRIKGSYFICAKHSVGREIMKTIAGSREKATDNIIMMIRCRKDSFAHFIQISSSLLIIHIQYWFSSIKMQAIVIKMCSKIIQSYLSKDSPGARFP